ncbi:MAG: glycoside hydrolase family 16 protein [Gammaproteobacteria bacterium]|nr:glycoside hydrolase family 16 protein [Gammaproteobacteria bacterium]
MDYITSKAALIMASLSFCTLASASTEWQLIYNEDFDGNALDRSIWHNEVNCYGGGNNELQCYTDGNHNVFVDDGHLIIEARQESFSGPAHFDDSPEYDPRDQSVTRDYTSARIRTKHALDIQYGRVEVRAKLPQGQGLWPAIWMLPTENRYGGWPHSGEIDIMEVVNLNSEGAENLVYGTLHYGDTWPNNSYSHTKSGIAPAPWANFHEYAIEWEQSEIRWYIDGEHYATQRPATADQDGWFTYPIENGQTLEATSANGMPFNHPFHLILNVAVGGDWPGDVGSETTFPQQMMIDYVRVYRCDGANERGEGCAGLKNEVDTHIPLSGNPLPE